MEPVPQPYLAFQMLLYSCLEFQFDWFAPDRCEKACWNHLLPSTLRVYGLTGYFTILTYWLCICFVYLQSQISKKLQLKLTDDCGTLLWGCKALEILQCVYCRKEQNFLATLTIEIKSLSEHSVHAFWKKATTEKGMEGFGLYVKCSWHEQQHLSHI